MSNVIFNPHIEAQTSFGRFGRSKEEIQETYGVETVYRMCFNESPLGTSPKVVQAIQEAAPTLGDYPPSTDDDFREAIAAMLGRGLTAVNLYTGNSGYEVLEMTVRAFLQPGDECIVCPPMFGVYNRLIGLQGAVPVSVPLDANDFSLDVEGVLTAVTPQTRMLLLCNPNNPTGTMITAVQMERLMNKLPDHVVVIADEVYHHFVTSPDYPDTLNYVLADKPVIIIHTFSKGYGLAGLRLGYGISTPEITDHIRKLYRGFHLNQLALVGGTVALKDAAHLQKNIDTVLQGRQYLQDQFDQLDLCYWPSQTNFIAVETPLLADDLVEAMLHYGIIISPLTRNGLPNVIRVSIGLPIANELFASALKEILSASFN